MMNMPQTKSDMEPMENIVKLLSNRKEWIAVIAGTREEFELYCRERKQNPHSKDCPYLFALNAEAIVGRAIKDYRMIGTWRRHPATHIEDLVAMLEMQKQLREGTMPIFRIGEPKPVTRKVAIENG